MKSFRAQQTTAADATGDYAQRRSARYDPLPVQIDRLTKMAAYLHAYGIDIGPDGRAQLDHVAAVKKSVPKG